MKPYKTNINNKGIVMEPLKLFKVSISLTSLFGIDAINRMLRGSGYLPLKRFIDILFSLLILPVGALIILLCAVLIKLDSPGRVFFLQERTGKGGKRFKMYKLRTMVNEAEIIKEKYVHLNKQSYPDFKISNDPRITLIGRFLRKSSLDELPQFINILKGDMSVVGPRPTSFSADTYSLWHTARLEMKPGITGLWQISGRHEVDFDNRSRLDIFYWKNFSLWLDLKIMIMTIFTVFRGHGAE
jgi:lipopolysaccharide/colanic/teichoic acid biosynthesis glycosyltransferase